MATRDTQIVNPSEGWVEVHAALKVGAVIQNVGNMVFEYAQASARPAEDFTGHLIPRGVTFKAISADKGFVKAMRPQKDDQPYAVAYVKITEP